MFIKGSFKVKKMWIERTIGANLTMKIMQSHIIYNIPIGPKQMNIPHFVRSKSQRKKLSYKRGVGQKMTKADEGGRGGHPNADNC